MSDDIVIRPFEPKDRQQVRSICADTADKGRPVENFFYDREIFADLLTRYYTDLDPGSLWVAVKGEEVAGYLMGCLDTRRFNGIMLWKITPKEFIRAIFRGVFLRRQTWRLVGMMLGSLRFGGFKRKIDLDMYPAHLHIDLKDGFRGQGIGRMLMEKFITQAKEKKVRGVHLTVRGDNFSACRFFENNGFKVLSRHPMLMPDGGSFIKSSTVVFGKIL